MDDFSVPVPSAVTRAAGGRDLRLVWVNEGGGLTFEATRGTERRFIKWGPPGSDRDLLAEASRMDWVRPYHPVPEPLDSGRDETGSWLVTTALPGRAASDEGWRADPATAVTAIGTGLRALHDALPVAGCPFSWSAEQRVADARQAQADGCLDPATWHPGHRDLGVAAALEAVSVIQPPDQIVVCHGDACAPNTLLTDDGRWSGHVDLGRLGVGDRWADLAVATWSAEWNYGPGWDSLLLDAYGIGPDPERTRYYRLLYDLSA